MTTTTNNQTIAQLNDNYRKLGGFNYTAACVQLLPPDFRKLRQLIMDFKDFNEGNDPYEEHDFGEVSVAGLDFFWKIDYYNHDLSGGSEDPADPYKTKRVLTVMRADEY